MTQKEGTLYNAYLDESKIYFMARVILEASRQNCANIILVLSKQKQV